MTKILLVRHGHVEGIKPEKFRGRADLVLTDRGVKEAQAVARSIATNWRPSHVFTSPLKRCVITGSAIGEVCGLQPRVLDDLNDIDYGAWQSQTYQEIKQSDPGLFDAWFTTPHLMRFPNGESLQDLVARTANALRFALTHHDGETLVFVSHDSVNRALLLQVLDQPLSAYWRLLQHPCCVNELDIIRGRISVSRINDTHHLSHLESGLTIPVIF